MTDDYVSNPQLKQLTDELQSLNEEMQMIGLDDATRLARLRWYAREKLGVFRLKDEE